MQTSVGLDYSVTDINKCYVVVNDEFYVQVEPEIWEALAEYLEKETDDKGWTQLCAERRTVANKEVK